MAALSLNYAEVLSDWEKCGVPSIGLDASEELQLDLSTVEAALNPPSKITDFTFNYFHMPCFFPALPAYAPPTTNPAATTASMLKPNQQQALHPLKVESDSCLQPVGIVKQDSFSQDSSQSSLFSSPSISSSDVAVVPDASSAQSSPSSSPCSFSLVPQSASSIFSSIPGMPFMPMSDTEQPVRTRLECLHRYKQKKASRLYTKKIRYQLRKINADRRPRIKGRFVKKEELETYLKGQDGTVSFMDGFYDDDDDDDDLMSELGDFSDLE